MEEEGSWTRIHDGEGKVSLLSAHGEYGLLKGVPPDHGQEPHPASAAHEAWGETEGTTVVRI